MRSWIKKLINSQSIRTLLLMLVIPFTLLIVLGYFWFYQLGAKQLHQQSSETAEKMVTQVSASLEKSLSSIYTSLEAQTADLTLYQLRHNLENEELPLTPQAYYRLYNKQQQYIQNNQNDMNSFTLYLDDSSILSHYSVDNSWLRGVHFDYSQYSELISGNRLSWIQLTEHPDLLDKTSLPSLGLMTLFGDSNTSCHGFLLYEIREEVLLREIATTSVSSGSRFGIYLNGTILSAAENSFSDEEKELLSGVSGQRTSVIRSPSGRRNYCFSHDVSLSNAPSDIQIGIIAMIPERDILLNRKGLQTALIMMIFILALMSAGLYQIISYLYTRPVMRLQTAIQNISENKLLLDAEGIGGGRELRAIHRSVDGLLERIRLLINRVNIEKDNRRIAELNVLHAQINPHFLYNTLDAIYQLCLIGEVEEAQEMTNELSVFYKIGVSKGEFYISLKEEFTHIRMYLAILETRYNDFSYELDLPSELEQYRCIKTILQPIVENAIYHGIRPTRAFGLIRVSAAMENGYILLKVSDNGTGMSQETLQALRRSLEDMTQKEAKTYGLRNVNARVQLVYGEPYGVQLDSTLDEGSLVTIRLPALLTDPELSQTEVEHLD